MEARCDAVNRRAVYFFCADKSKDPVAHNVFRSVVNLFSPSVTDLSVDNFPVLHHQNSSGEFYFVNTANVLSHDYVRYLPYLNSLFNDFDFAGIVNWHEGKNSPDPIFCVHTTGDVISGIFGAAHPLYTRNLLIALEHERINYGLYNFKTLSEATHWSGVLHGTSPTLITKYTVPIVDVEIGSAVESWGDSTAANAIASAIVRVFEWDDPNAKSVLCVGGVHFEPSFCHAVLNSSEESSIMVSHILANQWVVAGGYDQDLGLVKLESCFNSILHKVDAIVFHDNLKGSYKEKLRSYALQNGIPVFKHQYLRDPSKLPMR
ncbi:hypothetical protein D2Q93_06245 [Alicyclobacillaceae bacterium I2511]|nr:hypothetical protein D2Q93_06245 [Alicyclobacillaceae bacterium I2511]